MSLLSRLSAWFYDYPDFNVTEQELSVLYAVRDGANREPDLSIKLRLNGGDLKALLDRLRSKRLLAPHRYARMATVSAMGFAVVTDLDDPEGVHLSAPGAKLLCNADRSRERVAVNGK